MKKLLFVCGPAGIGKSTFCKNWIFTHPDENFVIVAADEVRRKKYGGYDKFPENKDMSIIYQLMVDRCIEIASSRDDVTVILDTTMLTDERRLFFADKLPQYERKELILLKLHDYSICIKRNRMRIGSKVVPEEIVINMIKSYADPSPETLKRFDSSTEIYLD